MKDDSRILEAWEESQALHPLHRALVMLRLARPAESIDSLAALTIADRDRGLLALRACLFGRAFQAVASCPACAETLDLEFGLDQLEESVSEPADVTFRLRGRKTTLRLPTTVDLLELIAVPAAERETALASQLAGRKLGAQDVTLVEQMLPKLDPLAEITVDFECPACGHRWTAPFDIAAYLWDELDDHAHKVMRDIDVLARTYGWAEAEILALPPRRRQAYLDLALEG